ncbi:MAG: hypothetical protein Q7R78_01295 [bacterium]|nr:hypothetical protein [bacterium]
MMDVVLGALGFEWFIKEIGNIYLQMASWFVAVGGMVLNAGISMTLQISTILNSVPGVNTVWTVIRDFTAIFFIFILVYVSIMTIVGSGDKNTVKKLVIGIVVAGFLINFSMFITKTIIDATNVLAIGFYDAITPDKSQFDGGLSDVFVGAMKMPTIYNAVSKANPGKLSNTTTYFVQTATGGTLMIIAAIVFLAGGILMFFRTVSLIGYIAVSPLFAFHFSPVSSIPVIGKYLGKMGSEYWSKFIKQALFAPLFLAIIYVALKIVEGNATTNMTGLINSMSTSAGGAKSLPVTDIGVFLATPGSSEIGLLVNYFILLGFFLAALKAGKDASFAGAEGITKWAENGTNWASNKLSTQNLARLIGKTTADTAVSAATGGKTRTASVALGNVVNNELDKFANKSRFGQTTLGRSLTKNLKSSFERSALGKAYKEESADQKDALNKIEERKKMETFTKVLVEHKNRSDQTQTVEAGTFKAVSDAVGTMSDKQKESIEWKDIKEHKEVVALLGNEYFEKMFAKEGFNPGDKKEVEDIRRQSFAENLEKAGVAKNTTILSNFKKLSASDIQKIHDISISNKSDATKDPTKSILLTEAGLMNITVSTLKEIREKDLIKNIEEKKAIANAMLELYSGPKHMRSPAFDDVSKNREYWGMDVNDPRFGKKPNPQNQTQSGGSGI